jgi:hypothetical protein
MSSSGMGAPWASNFLGPKTFLNIFPPPFMLISSIQQTPYFY